jgi:rare lipoprotein A
VDTGAHLQAPTALTPLQQLRRMAPAPGLQLPDPLRAARQALRDEMVDEQGIASWYGPGLHGRRTASGERFNTHDFTAAHPHYAFGTRLCVLSRDGKAVEVRVNDRGPYAKNRIIDLSRAAAEALDMVDSGVRRVQLWKLDAEETCDDRLDVLAAAAEAG